MIYLDNAATTLRKPACVARAVAQALEGMGNAGRGAHDASLDASRVVFAARQRLAALFGMEDPSCIAFTMNATQSLNTAIKGLLAPGDHVITTAMEHNSVLRPIYEMGERGVEITILPADAQGCVAFEAYAQAIRPNTRAIVCAHASNLTGNVQDIARIGALARARGAYLIVDAAQTAGVLEIDMRRMGVDVLCFTGHKGLLGPQGTGGLAVRRGVAIRPLLCGGSGVQSYSRTHPAQMPTALEAGTLNAHGIAGLLAALEYIEATGMDAIREKESALMRRFHAQVSGVPGVTVYGDFAQAERCAIVSLNIRDYDSAQVSDALFAQYGISTRAGAHCAPLMHEALGTREQGAVRFSFSHMNTLEEIDIAAAAVRELAQEEEN